MQPMSLLVLPETPNLLPFLTDATAWRTTAPTVGEVPPVMRWTMTPKLDGLGRPHHRNL